MTKKTCRHCVHMADWFLMEVPYKDGSGSGHHMEGICPVMNRPVGKYDEPCSCDFLCVFPPFQHCSNCRNKMKLFGTDKEDQLGCRKKVMFPKENQVNDFNSCLCFDPIQTVLREGYEYWRRYAEWLIMKKPGIDQL